TGACIPTDRSFESTVVALDDVPERRGIGIEQRVQVPGRTAVDRIRERHECSPQRRDCARATDDRVGAVDTHVLTRLRISIARNVGDTAPGQSNSRAGGCGCSESPLPTRYREESAHTPTPCSAARALTIPNHLARDLLSSGAQAGATAAEYEWTGGRKVH